MVSKSRILLVEGKADEAFYKEVCRIRELNIDVKVAPPRELGGAFNSKGGVLDLLPALLNQLPDGRVERLGVIVDADYKSSNGLGYEETFARIATLFGQYGFAHAKDSNSSGAIFKSADNLPDIGLWVMPDNQGEGMLEDWIKKVIINTEDELMSAAVAATQSVVQKKFKSIHVAKAEIATWLAWQEKPGNGLEYTVKMGLLDLNAQHFSAFSNWLQEIYT